MNKLNYLLNKKNYFYQALTLFWLILCCLGLVFLISNLLNTKTTLNWPRFQVLRFEAVFSSLVGFVLPCFIFHKIYHRTWVDNKNFHFNITVKTLVIAVFILITTSFFMKSLDLVNLLFPKIFLLNAQNLEEKYNLTVINILHFKSSYDLLIALFVIALIPAISEEFIFRVHLQPLCIGVCGQVFWGIFISSTIFSLLHISVIGFLPRILLGLVLGYLYQISKTFWLNSLIHFINNAFIVLVLYFNRDSTEQMLKKLNNTSEIDFSISGIMTLLFSLVSGILLILLFKALKKQYL